MSDLIAWLRGCLDEDERVVRAVTGSCWFDCDGEGHGDHHQRWDEDRVLAEVAAKREILDLHKPAAITGATCCADANRYPCRTVRMLAQPYAGRDGWREEWRV